MPRSKRQPERSFIVTMTDEIVFPAATNEDSNIVPEGRWTLELLGIEDAPPSQFRPEDGRRFKWNFALYDGPGLAPGQRFVFNNEPYIFYRHTSKKNSPRATARKYAEALIGKKFDDGYVPTVRDMVGRRMSGVVAYEISEFDSSQTVLKLLSLKSAGSPATTAQAAPARPAPAGRVSADPSEADVDRALVVSSLHKSVATLMKLDGASAKLAQDAIAQSDLDTAPIADIESLHASVKAAIAKAME
jgi:hypothetical protein